VYIERVPTKTTPANPHVENINRARPLLREAILEILAAGRVPLGAAPTEAAILYAVRHLDVITPWAQWGSRSLARTVLGELIGSRVGAVTTGEVVITSYAGGSEVYGLRAAA
jgi:hypothetical protein